jgi:hypothetical protein
MSDDDCTTGFCFNADYSTERFCSALSGASTCVDTQLNPPGCPQPTAGSPWKASMCAALTPNAIDCYGIVSIGTSTAAGCWSVH